MQTETNQEVQLNSNKNSVATFAIVLSLFMAAVDGTIVSTVLPEISTSLGQPSLYPLIMSGFLLPVALIAPFIGAIGDKLGIKPTLVASILVFIVASIFAANAITMQMLIFSRVIQGVGAGSIIVLCYALLAAVFSVDERAKMQGMLSGVWGISAILGPILGGLLSSMFGWKSIFLINVPIGLIALVMLLQVKTLELGNKQSQTRIDFLAQISFAIMCFSVMMLVSENHIEWLNNYVLTLLFLGAFIVLIARVLKNAKASPIPAPFFKHKPLVSTVVMVLVSSATLYSAVTIIPITLAQLGQSTVSLSALITTAALGWVFGAAICGSKLAKFGFKLPAFIGMLLLFAGTIGMIPAINSTNVIFIAGCLAFIGLGMGFVSTCTLVYVQNSAPKEQLSSWTSTVQFLRNIGSAVGISLFTSIQLSQHGGYEVSFYILAAVIFIGSLFSFALPKSYK
ncbi:MFS transporter [Vibrio sp. S11_S32]|uniref:MFS transporter n=1 Tax=Vibrio sp. S11_S32 TaxID=2720225 RepID=UPI001681B0BC|nr:MFS transporter [Vibrio sp. S11_S32]MBD1578003.1 MFS transporter [Vibrio sp. S11_S32]